MRPLNRKVILVDRTLDQKTIDWSQLEVDEKEAFILDPFKLFTQIDWTRFEDNVEVINIVYSDLFEALVVERKTLICYWPMLNFPDDQWVQLLEQCKSTGIQMLVNYTKDRGGDSNDMLPEFQEVWKSFVLFMVESLFEDIQLNEGFEEIAWLKNSEESILLFSVDENGVSKYSYLLCENAVFEFETSFEVQKKIVANAIPFYNSIEQLMEMLQLEINLGKCITTYVNRRLEKNYFNSLLKKHNSNNLIQHWIENYSDN
ncbi:hypothetical protein SAMN04489723_110159 [Algoriphagus aquimarinus]|uniref:Uncharacterized protein n=2 Tax=Algoriphagus aquimarinus TaxID=237018 RepID=A0A1I1B334_9BACT|nr:hypothetical protein SAMN04489723_110159 [Algoriphagus aquimarinus]